MSKQHEMTIPRCMPHASGHRLGEPGKLAEAHHIPETHQYIWSRSGHRATLLKCILYLMSALLSLIDAMDLLEHIPSPSWSCRSQKWGISKIRGSFSGDIGRPARKSRMLHKIGVMTTNFSHIDTHASGNILPTGTITSPSSACNSNYI
ncbi:hypothetical protein B0H11DRAFT_1908674 [Mycena galericulata]|nr:hypothetical protein B0H11DRAFT_1908674 [Mycena galericulata]